MNNREKAKQYRTELEKMSTDDLCREFDRAMQYLKEQYTVVKREPDVYKRISSSAVILLG